MKKVLTLLVVSTLVISGCKKPKPIETTKNYVVENYKLGVFYSLGFSYTF